jgi:hypothetical protein
VQAKIKKLLGIPEPFYIYDTMAVGYGAYQKPMPRVVKAREDLIHYDACGPADFRTDEVVAAFAKKTKDWCMSAHFQEADYKGDK